MKNLILLLLPFFLFACKGEDTKNKKDKVKHLDVFSESAEKLSFQSIRMVPLESGEDILIGGRFGLKVHNDEFFVLDKKNQRVLRFNSEGEFLNKIGKPGRGPKEYKGLDDFSIQRDTVYFLDGGAQTTITGYRKSGDFLYSKTFDIPSRCFEKVKSKYVIYSSYNSISSSPFRLKTIDEKGNIKNTYLKNNTKLTYPVPANLLQFGSVIYFQEGYHNSTYILESSDLEKTYTFDFGEYSIPDAFFEMDRREGLNLIQNKGFASLRCYFGNKAIDVFEVLVIQKNKDAKVFQIIYDRQQNRLYRKKFNMESDNYLPYKQPSSVTRNNELVYLSSAYGIIENRESLKDVVVNDKALEGMEENDNPVVLFCEINK